MNSLGHVVVKMLKTDSYVETLLKDLWVVKEGTVNHDLIQKYHRITSTNSKQPQATKHGAGTRRVTHPSGTNKGRSRLPFAVMSRGRIPTNAPNCRKGRKAHRFMMNQKNLKMNKKEKKLAVRSLILETLLKSEILLMDEFKVHGRTSEILTTLKTLVGGPLKKFLEEPKNKKKKTNRVGPCTLIPLPILRNYPNVLHLNLKNTFYSQLYRGARVRPALIANKETLELLLKRYQLIDA